MCEPPIRQGLSAILREDKIFPDGINVNDQMVVKKRSSMHNTNSPQDQLDDR
jgi:hypothetical protein